MRLSRDKVARGFIMVLVESEISTRPGRTA